MKTHDELCRMLPHVFYVFEQTCVFALWHDLKTNRPQVIPALGSHPEMWKNATIESSLLSLRTLNEFFTPMEPNKRRNPNWDDCRAEEFPGFSHLGSFLPDADKVELDKRLSHLSWSRLGPHKGWQVGRLIRLGIVRMIEFLRYLKSEFLPWDHPLVPAVNALLEDMKDFTPHGQLAKQMEEMWLK